MKGKNLDWGVWERDDEVSGGWKTEEVTGCYRKLHIRGHHNV
jgi:hypothetical protein